jgi:hypothetical protein
MAGELLVPLLVISTVARKASTDAGGVGVLGPLGHDVIDRILAGVCCQEHIAHYGFADAGRRLLETLDTQDDAAVGSGDGEGAEIDDAGRLAGVAQLNDLLYGRDSVERHHVEFNQTAAMCGGVGAPVLPQLLKILKSSGRSGGRLKKFRMTASPSEFVHALLLACCHAEASKVSGISEAPRSGFTDRSMSNSLCPVLPIGAENLPGKIAAQGSTA